MPALETTGYRRWWPMRQFLGRGQQADGTRIQYEQEVYRDMVTGEVHVPVSKDGEAQGWTGSPPDAASGSQEKAGCERTDQNAYREGWERVFGKKTKANDAKSSPSR